MSDINDVKLQLTLTYMKSTKNKHVYGDDKEGAVISGVYLHKSGLPANPPEQIRLLVQYDETN